MTKRKRNADRMKALAEEYRRDKGKKPAKKAPKSPPKKEDWFDKADKDGDGKLSKEEYKAAEKE